jgi:fimbrial isopeptide formation D2 family protein
MWGTRTTAPRRAVRSTGRRWLLTAVAAALTAVGITVPVLQATAATASVTVSNPVLSGTAPVKVGDSLTFTASLSGVTGAVGDTFTIALPAELTWQGAISFSLSGLAQCAWSGQVATCTLTQNLTNASGGISLALKAQAEHSGSSTITIGSSTVTPSVPGGTISPGSGGGGTSTYGPAPSSPVKEGAWDSSAGVVRWIVTLPVSSTATRVTISDALVSGNEYSPHSFVFSPWDWDLLSYVPNATTATDVAQWHAPGSPTWVNSSIANPNAALTVTGGKQLSLSFTAQPNVVYRFTYYTVPDTTPSGEVLLKNNVQVGGNQTDAIVKIPSASGWLVQNYARFAIKKVVTGAKASDVPVGTTFTVHYTAGGTSKNLTVPYDFTTVVSDWAPAGTTFTIGEINLPTISGMRWGGYTITGTGVTKNADGTYSVTPAAGATLQLVLTNTADNPPTPAITIVKKDAAGNDADTAATAVDLTKSGGATGLVFTVTNSGTEDLVNVNVTDSVTAGSGTVSGLSCDFSSLGGPSTGTTWAGPFLVGAHFPCTAQLSGVTAGAAHTDVATVTAVGKTSGTPVSDDNPYHADVQGKVSVGDFVWVDTNGDGRQDAGEPGIPGVTLVLTGPDGKPVTDVYGNPVPPTVTDGAGKYSFDNLPILDGGQTYTVSIDQTASKDVLAPYVPTIARQGDRAGDSSTWTASSQGLTQDGQRDPTLDFGFVTAPTSPAVSIVKTDDHGNDADTAATAVDLTGSDGATGLRFTITNSGTEDLVNVDVSDSVTAGSGRVTGLSCDFSPLGGPATGTSWDGPFLVGAHFTCTADLKGVTAGDDHTDVATVDAVGKTSGTPVSDDNPYHADVQGKVSVGDFVWVDTNGDGRQDAGEPGIPGVTLVLTGPDGKPVTDVYGNPVPPTVTDGAGKYSFDNLPILDGGQTYTVSIDQTASADALAPYVPTIAGQGDRAGDSSTWTASSQGLTNDGDRDQTLDFGFVTAPTPPTSPAVNIVKTDDHGNDADTAATAVDLTGSDGATGLRFTIANTGDEDLVNVRVSDKVTKGSASVSGLSCDFSPLGGPATGTSWDGPFLVGAHFTCTADLKGVTAGDDHTDVATVDAVGKTSGTPVSDDNPYHADVQGKVSVGDFVWVDTNGDGRQDAGEPGIPGVTLVLTGPDGKPVTDVYGNPVPPTVTDADGKYTFDNLPVLNDGQTYTVTIDQTASKDVLAPYVPTIAGQGDRAGDSSTWTASSQGLTKDGDRDRTLDFGFVPKPVPTAATPGFAVTKTSDPASGTLVDDGDTITYTVTGTNTGDTALNPVTVTDNLTDVLDNATFVDGSITTSLGDTAVLDGTTLTWNGTLAQGQAVVITYKVTVKPGQGGQTVGNRVHGTATPPNPDNPDEPGTPIVPPDVETRNPIPSVPGFILAKSADPAPGTQVADGDTITYTVTGTNTGNTVLDPVVLTDTLADVLDNAAFVDGSITTSVGDKAVRHGSTLSWKGALQPGEKVVITYQVTVKAGQAGEVARNSVHGAATPPNPDNPARPGTPIVPPDVETEHPIGPTDVDTVDDSPAPAGSGDTTGDLAFTGADVLPGGLLGIGLLGAGGMAIVASRGRRRRQ